MAAKILIVEDDQLMQDVLVGLVRARGHTVWSVADGGAAVIAATTHVPDLVLCDLNLPSVDGHEVVQQLHESTRTHHIPVIALTATGSSNDDPETIARIRDRIVGLGFVGYIPKPINPKTFIAEIEAHLPLHLRDR